MKIFLFVIVILLQGVAFGAQAIDEKQLGEMMLTSKVTVTNPYLDTCNTKSECGRVFKLHHPGIDYRARTPQTVLSPVEGVIVHSIFRGDKFLPQKDRYGTIVIKVDGLENAFFMVAHMSKSFVAVGDTVQPGCKIGLTGKKGTIHPHLHVEYRVGEAAAQKLTSYAKAVSEIKRRGNRSPTDAVAAYMPRNVPTECSQKP